MSVLTVTNTVVPTDRTTRFTIPVNHQGLVPLSNAPTRELPNLPVELPTYTRDTAQKSQPAVANTHRHSRTVSSGILPTDPFASSKPTVANHRHSSYIHPSTSTASRSYHYHPQTHPTQPQTTMQRQSTTGSTSASIPRRSTSSRSVATNSPTSYVTLMRKQKATVWCDRSQSIDARLAAQQKAAKQRAVLEVVGTNSSGARTSTISSGGVVGKIRHGGVPKAAQYTSPNMSGVNVPTRLLAFDMAGEDESSEGRVLGDNSMVHARSGSGKSSIGSQKYRSGYPRAAGAHVTPPEGTSPSGGAREGIPEVGETPRATEEGKDGYFEQAKHGNANDSDEEDTFGEFKPMAGPNSKQHAMDQKAKDDDLRRKGSIDERTTTMRSTQRLFIANPDLDD